MALRRRPDGPCTVFIFAGPAGPGPCTVFIFAGKGPAGAVYCFLFDRQAPGLSSPYSVLRFRTQGWGLAGRPGPVYCFLFAGRPGWPVYCFLSALDAPEPILDHTVLPTMTHKPQACHTEHAAAASHSTPRFPATLKEESKASSSMQSRGHISFSFAASCNSLLWA